MNLQECYNERYRERTAKIRELLDRNGIEYTEMGDYNPICFVINWGNKNDNNEIVTNTDNIVMYFSLYNFSYTYCITKIYDTKGKDQTKISETIDNLNLFEATAEKYYIDENDFVCMKCTKRNASEEYAIDSILTFKNYLFNT
ncbi:MAG: hypothetical protein K2J35_01135, partial [Eubacterium sp.]|nr:hypothetical protein [Eubacterium sp.]